MFSSLQKSDELYFQIPSTPFQEQDPHPNLLHHYLTTSSSSTNLYINPTITNDIAHDNKFKTPRKGRKISQQEELALVDDGNNDRKKKKMEHREIERQRRQEMAKLYSSLRSLLPLDFIKGRRSISDHMHQAVNYIKHLQDNIKGLDIKKEKLKKISQADPSKSNVLVNHNVKKESSDSNNGLPNTVTVNGCHGGVEILVNSYPIEEGFPLSRVLKALIQEGLDVVSCSSTKINGRLIHSIQSEVSDPTFVQVSLLQQKMTDLINNP